MIHGLHHCAIATDNIERLVEFYCGAFGFQQVNEGRWDIGNQVLDSIVGLKDTAARYAMLRAGHCFLELFQYSSPTPAPGDPRRRACDPGLTHLCLSVTDIDAEFERLSALGMHFHAPPFRSDVMRTTYGRDPDGNIVELMEVLDGKHPYRMPE
jgi:catechol 2,3-dioxygenase-like lactoylglutathione lyase family enzyme